MEVDREAHAEPFDDLLHGGRETLPLDVGLGAGEQQEGRTRGVLDEPHLEGGHVVVRPAVAPEGEQRAAGPVVDEPVVVEPRHDLVRQRVEDPVHDLVAGLARVDVSVEVVEHDQSGRLLGERHVHHGQALRLPCVQTLRIKHCDRSSSCSLPRTPVGARAFPLRAPPRRLLTAECAPWYRP